MDNIEYFIWKNTPDSKHHAKTSESGLHSDIYLNSDYITSNPGFLMEIVETKFIPELKSRNIHPDWIITYPPYGIAIGYELAKQLWAKFAYINKKDISCSFPISEWETAVIIADDIYSGGNIRDTISIIKWMGVNILNPILSIANFWKENTIGGFEIFSLISEQANLYKETDCPLCKSGSIGIIPRGNWEKLRQWM